MKIYVVYMNIETGFVDVDKDIMEYECISMTDSKYTLDSGRVLQNNPDMYHIYTEKEMARNAFLSLLAEAKRHFTIQLKRANEHLRKNGFRYGGRMKIPIRITDSYGVETICAIEDACKVIGCHRGAIYYALRENGGDMKRLGFKVERLS